MSEQVASIIGAQTQTVSYLSRDTSGAGLLSFSGVFQFNGTWVGDFEGKGGDANLTFMPDSKFSGTVKCQEVLVYGTLSDVSIEAVSVKIYSGAFVSGRILCEKIQLEDGAKFKGRMMPSVDKLGVEF